MVFWFICFHFATNYVTQFLETAICQIWRIVYCTWNHSKYWNILANVINILRVFSFINCKVSYEVLYARLKNGRIMLWQCPSVCPSVRPKAACQFAADDILLYIICYNIQWIYFTIWDKGKEELSPLQYHFKSLHIISRHYKKSLLRSQIYHGYEELSTDTNYPIWRRQKLPYMKKTRKKKQVCGAACFMAAEIKFSEDVRPSVQVFRTFFQRALRYQFET